MDDPCVYIEIKKPPRRT